MFYIQYTDFKSNKLIRGCMRVEEP